MPTGPGSGPRVVPLLRQTAPVPEITTAGAALVISILVALWNLLKHLLEGGRVRVTMRPGLHDEYSLGTAKTWRQLAQRARQDGGWKVEVAVIEVENAGRTAVTIRQPSLWFRASPWWRRKLYTVSPQGREHPGATTDGRCRLEPFDSVFYVYEIWPYLSSGLRSDDPPLRPFRLGARVQVAGKRRPRRSSRRSRWLVQEDQRAFIPEIVELGLEVYRSLQRRAGSDKYAQMACIPTAIEVRKHFPVEGPAPTAHDLANIIERHYFNREPSGFPPLAGFWLSEDIKHLFKLSEDGQLPANEVKGSPRDSVIGGEAEAAAD